MEYLNALKLKRLLTFSMLGIGAEIRKQQDNILLRERFGIDTVEHPGIYNPNIPFSDDQLEIAIKRCNENIQMAKEIQSLMDNLDRYSCEIALESFFKSKI